MAGTSSPDDGQPDEAALARGMREGDPAAFEHVVRAYGGRLLAVARRILRNDEEARDAVQEAFISAYRARAQFGAASRVSTWLHRIAVNAALMRLRRRRRHTEESIDEWMPSFQSDGHFADRFASWTERPDQHLARKEVRDAVRRAVERLPDNYRVVLTLRDIEGFDTAETAEALGLTPNAVKIRLHRARMALRTLLEPAFQRGSP